MLNRTTLFAALLFLLVDVTLFAQQKLDLNDVIGADGSLTLPARFQGTIDARGFTMLPGSDGAPRFTRQPRPSLPVAADPDDRYWDDSFGDVAPDYAYIRTIAVNGSDIYVTGDFSIIDGVPATGIARWDGSRWHALGEGVVGDVMAIEFMGEDMIIGGTVWQAGEIYVGGLARWDGSNWHPLGTDSNSGVAGYVLALASVGDDLYVGGDFEKAGDHFDTLGIRLGSIGRWNRSANTWHALVDGDSSGVAGYVTNLALDEGLLYVAGSFESAGTIEAQGLATWSISSQQWTKLGERIPGRINTMAMTPGALYIGGYFSEGEEPPSIVMRWDIAQQSWSALHGDTALDGNLVTASKMIIHNGEPVIIGVFQTDDAGVYDARLAAWDGTRWRGIDSGLPSLPQLLISTDGNGMLALGDSGVEGSGRSWIASRVGNDQWEITQVRVRGGAWTSIEKIVVMGDDIYMAGSIHHVGDLVVDNLVRWHRPTNRWHHLEDDATTQMRVFVTGDMEVHGERLALAGLFLDDQYDFHYGLRIWDPVTEQWSWGARTSGMINTIASYGTRLYVGGSFDTIAGVRAMGAAILNADGSWESLGLESIDLLTGISIQQIVPSEKGTYLYGSFNSDFGGVTGIARWMGGEYALVAADLQGYVNDMTLVGDDLYIGGRIDYVEGVTVRNIARYDDAGWHTLGEGVNGEVHTLASRGTDLYVGGLFDTAGTVAANNIARWNGSRWNALGSGTNNSVLAMALDAEDLYVGGIFTFAGGKPSLHFARWSPSITAVPQRTSYVTGTTLGMIHPNPAGSMTSISIDVATTEHLALEIVDARGRHIALLHKGTLAAGRHEFVWNVEGIAAGVYFVNLATPAGRVNGRIVVVR